MTKDELVALAEERGVEIDKRWKSEKIAEALGLQAEPDADADKAHAVPDGMKRLRITKFGAGKVSNGKGGYKNAEGRIAYGKCAQGDEITVADPIAAALEAKGFAETL